MIAAAPLIGGDTYTVTRKAAGSYVDGEWVSGADSTFEIFASVQPMSGDEMQRESEGLRATHGVKIYARLDVILRTVEDAGAGATPGLEADVITYEGRDYQIQRILPWTSRALLPHRKYIALAPSTGREVAP